MYTLHVYFITKRITISNLSHWTQNDILALKNVGLNSLIRSKRAPENSWISNDNTYINKWWNDCTDSRPLKKTTYCHKAEWQDKHVQYKSCWVKSPTILINLVCIFIVINYFTSHRRSISTISFFVYSKMDGSNWKCLKYIIFPAHNRIKTSCLLWLFSFIVGDTLGSNSIPFKVVSGIIFSTNQSVIWDSLFKSEYTQRADVRLINIFNFNCLACDWTF